MASAAKITAKTVKQRLGQFLAESITAKVIDEALSDRPSSFHYETEHVSLKLVVAANYLDTNNMFDPFGMGFTLVPGKLVVLKIINVKVRKALQKKGIFTYLVKKLDAVALANKTAVAGVGVMQVQNPHLRRHLARKKWTIAASPGGLPCFGKFHGKAVAAYVAEKEGALH